MLYLGVVRKQEKSKGLFHKSLESRVPPAEQLHGYAVGLLARRKNLG